VPVAHACNPSYSGGRDQEDGSSKPAQVNSSCDPILKIRNIKRVGGVAQSVGPQFKPWHCKKKKKKNQSLSGVVVHGCNSSTQEAEAGGL
jgi:hypothetical protein